MFFLLFFFKKKSFVKKKEGQLNVYNFLHKNIEIFNVDFKNFMSNIGTSYIYFCIRNTNIINSRFNNGEFLHTDFHFCKIYDSYFNNIIFDNVNFNNTKFYKTTFKNVLFTDNFFINTNFNSCTFIDCVGNFSYFSPRLEDLFEDCVFENSFQMKCPEKGEYIAYKKIFAGNKRAAIAKLLIPVNVMRSSAFGNKCRADKAVVLDIFDVSDFNFTYNSGYSAHDSTFKYEIGKMVEVKDFDTNRWHECSTGIHHFMTIEEAMQY